MEILFVSIFASFIGSILGLGGGFILVPLLNLVLGFSIKDAIFLSLSSVFFLSILQCLMNRELMRQNRKPLLRMSGFAVLGSAIAAWIGARSPDIALSIGFAVFLMSFGVIFWRSSNDIFKNFSGKFRQSGADAMMVVAGLSSGFFGIGGGIITVPVLHHFLLKSMKDCTRLSFFVQFFATGVGLLVYFHSRPNVLHEMPPSILIFLLGGSLIGFIISRRFKIHDEKLKKLFATMIILVGLWKLLSLFL